MVSILRRGQQFFRQQIFFITQNSLRFSMQLQKSLWKNITENSFSQFPPRISSLPTLRTISLQIKHVEDRYQERIIPKKWHIMDCWILLRESGAKHSVRIQQKAQSIFDSYLPQPLIFWGSFKLNKLSKYHS